MKSRRANSRSRTSNPLGHVLDRILVRILGQAQESGAVVSIARSDSALGIHMDVAEMDVTRAVQPRRRGEGPTVRVTR